jgi:hypothetical protein
MMADALLMLHEVSPYLITAPSYRNKLSNLQIVGTIRCSTHSKLCL